MTMSIGTGHVGEGLKLFSPRISVSRGFTGNHAIAVALQVVADEIARTQLVARQPDDGNRLRVVEDALDRQRILVARQVE